MLEAEEETHNVYKVIMMFTAPLITMFTMIASTLPVIFRFLHKILKQFEIFVIAYNYKR